MDNGQDLNSAGRETIDYALAPHEPFTNIRVAVLGNDSAALRVVRDGLGNFDDSSGHYASVLFGIPSNILAKCLQISDGLGRPDQASHFFSRSFAFGCSSPSPAFNWSLFAIIV